MPDVVAIKEPLIYTMPERFRMKPKKGLSQTAVFFIVVGILFVLVVGGAVWYFTRELRLPAPAPTTISTEISQPSIASPGPTPEESVQQKEVGAEVPAPAGQPAVLPPTAPSPAGAPLPSPEAVAPSVAAPLPSPDLDVDGLTALEEGIFKTNPSQPDTDADGYLDGHEVLHLYNPAGIAPQRLEAAGLASRYLNKNFSYEILYPTAWQAEEIDGEGKEVRFKSASGEYMALLTYSNPDNLSFAEWYKKEAPAGEVNALKQTVTKSGLTGLVSPDNRTIYFSGPGKFFILNYYLADKTEINYQRVFEMMTVSFSVR